MFSLALPPLTCRCYGRCKDRENAVEATTGRESAVETNSAYAWRRLAYTGLISAIGGVGMWSFIVALPAVQADFGITRAEASLPYTLLMLGFGAGGIFMGKLADRHGIVPPLLIAIASLGAGYVLSGFATSIWQLALVHGILMGLCDARRLGAREDHLESAAGEHDEEPDREQCRELHHRLERDGRDDAVMLLVGIDVARAEQHGEQRHARRDAEREADLVDAREAALAEARGRRRWPGSTRSRP